ncbi:helix-turn-helix domain-containing protein [Roseibium sp.]|uniref:helix-turn-helix domain-containing protein n=1 Tax=Roseibium sp. TaxID=1936156 RepID=UPI003B51533D
MAQYDLTKMRTSVENWDLDVQPLDLVARKELVADFSQFKVAELLCDHVSFFANFSHKGTTPRDHYTFSIPAPNAPVFWHSGHSVRSGQIVVQTPNCEINVITPAGFEIFHVSVPDQELHCLLRTMNFDPAKVQRLPRVFNLPQDLAGRLWDSVSKRPCASEEGQGRFATDLCHRVVKAWVAQDGLTDRQISPTAAKRALQRCLEAVTRNDYSRLTVHHLCDNFHISRRALEMEFRNNFGVGPAAFLKAVRLTEARRRLMAATNKRVQVGDIMHDLGFAHVGQFAGAYRTMFDELPSETLLRGRADRLPNSVT